MRYNIFIKRGGQTCANSLKKVEANDLEHAIAIAVNYAKDISNEIILNSVKAFIKGAKVDGSDDAIKEGFYRISMAVNSYEINVVKVVKRRKGDGASLYCEQKGTKYGTIEIVEVPAGED